MADQTPLQPITPGSAPTPPVAGPTPPPGSKSNATKIVVIILIVLGVLAAIGLVGTYLLFRFADKAVDHGIEEINRNAQELQDYPDAYKEAGLPQYPGGEVVSLSRKTATVHDGISVIVTTSDPTTKVTQYFDEQLKAKGWTTESNVEQSSTEFYYRVYKKGDEEFKLTVTTSTEKNETSATLDWGMAAE